MITISVELLDKLIALAADQAITLGNLASKCGQDGDSVSQWSFIALARAARETATAARTLRHH